VLGLWLALALLEPRAGSRRSASTSAGRRARDNFERAGVLSAIDLVLGDAHALVTRIEGPVDMVFSDADKEGYLDYLQKLVPVLRPGSLFVTHNIDMAARDYVGAISNDGTLESTLVDVGSGEIAVTVKKRS
jgi:predicted O-methyltransferase YrrM